MVDRVTTYTQALGRSTDFLQAQQDMMIGLAWEAQATLGTSTVVDGFTCAPTTPASLVVNLGAGAIYQLANLEATTWSSLPANTASSIVKQGLMQSVDPITLAPPSTVGYSQCFLIEVQYADLDTTPTLLPYYNSSNPSQPYQGPSNSGVSQNTARLGIASVQVKAGIAAATGSQVAPSPDAGWTGLFVITLSNGQTTITSGNIAAYSPSSFIPVKLPGVPSGVQNGQWVYGAASGTNTYAVTLFSTATYPFTLTTGMEILVYFANANTTTTPTLNANGSGAKSIVKQGGGAPAVANATASTSADISGWVPLIYDGTNWRINGLVQSDVLALIQANVRTRVPSNLTLYVRTDGNDANDGSANDAAHAYATAQAAVNSIASKYDLGAQTVTIRLGTTGTFVGAINVPPLNGTIVFQGDTANPQNYILSTAGGHVVQGANVTFQGVTLYGTNAAYNILSVLRNGVVTLNYVNFGASVTLAAAAARVYPTGSLSAASTTINVNCSGQNIWLAAGGYIGFSTVSTIIGGGATVSVAFAQAFQDGVVEYAGTNTFSGTLTGPRYKVQYLALINTYGGGATYLPGSTAGTADNTTGGYYA